MTHLETQTGEQSCIWELFSIRHNISTVEGDPSNIPLPLKIECQTCQIEGF